MEESLVVGDSVSWCWVAGERVQVRVMAFGTQLALAGMLMVVVAACGGGGEPAGDVARRQIELTSQGQFDEVWELLHPAQQAVVPRQLYIDCGRQLAREGASTVDRIEMRGTDEDERNVPWVGETDVQVVNATIYRGEDPSPVAVVLVKSGDEWRWVIGEDQVSALEAFQRGECPA